MVKAKTAGIKKNKISTPVVEKEAPAATQVVEVVAEVKEASVSEGPKTENEVEIEDRSTSEVKAEDEEKAVEDQSEVKEEVAQVSEAISVGLHEKNREVVEEIFTHKNAHISDEIVPESKSNMASVYWWAIALISCAVTIGGILIYINSKDRIKFEMPFNLTKPTPTVQSTPTATPIPPDKTKLKVKVLNGAGVLGAAGKMKTFLEGKGYTVVGMGNAKSYDYEETVIQMDFQNGEIANLLKSELSSDFKVASEVASLASGEEADVVVIVGKK